MVNRILNREKSWNKFKKEKLDLLNHNAEILKLFLKDFELGINTPKKKRGRRTAGTLLKLRGSNLFILQHFPKTKIEDLTKENLHKLFDDMYKGKIKKQCGEPFKDVGDYIKNIKTFFGWLVRTNKVNIDITEDLTSSEFKRGKPAWIYLGQEKMKKLIDSARGDYRALLLFLYDSGLRPQEAYQIKVSDLSEDCSVLIVPKERADGTKISKTFERTIKLKQCSEMIKNYIEMNKLKSNDYLIIPTQPAFNKYIRTLSEKLFGKEITKARGSYNQLKLYDIRHNACCFWLDRYKTNKDLMYRMGWLKEDKVLYYSEFLGRRDKIDDEDMMTKEDKTTMEKELEKVKGVYKNQIAVTEFLLKRLMKKGIVNEDAEDIVKAMNLIETNYKLMQK